MRKVLKWLGQTLCLPIWPILVILAVIVALLWSITATAQSVCTYVEQQGTTKNCVGMAQLNQVGAVTNGSGTIATGNTSQQVFAANPARTLLIIQNPANATEVLYVDFGTPATAATAIELQPGGTVNFVSGVTPTGTVNVSAATAGHVYKAKQG